VGWQSALICLASAANRRRGELLLSKRAIKPCLSIMRGRYATTADAVHLRGLSQSDRTRRAGRLACHRDAKRTDFFAVDFADFNKTEMQLLAIVD
jgi:hypothetical protein